MSLKSSIPPQDRGFFYAASGLDTNEGHSLELPKGNIQPALDSTQSLIPTPDTSNTAFVREAQGGVYVTDLTLYDSVLFEGSQTTIVCTGAIGIQAASFMSFSPQTTVSQAAGSVLLNVDSIQSFGNNQAAMILNGDNVTGVNIEGACANLFFEYNQVSLRNDGQTAAMVAGTSGTPIKINYGEVSFEGDNQTLIDYTPDNATDSIDVRVDSLFFGMGGPFTGNCAFKCSEGVLKVRGGSLQSNNSFEVSGGLVAVSMLAVAGDVTVTGGNVAFDTVGQLVGNVTVSGAGSFQYRGSNVTGNLVTSGTGGASVKCDTFTGNITIGAGTTSYIVINNHIGTLTNNGDINGIINGVYYGNWQDDNDVGYVFTSWGGDLQTTGRHPAINGQSNAAEITSLGIDASAQIPADGTIDVLTYYSATGDNTTQFQIILNGVVAHTFTCDAAYGRETGIGVPVVVGDNVAIRYISGAAPRSGIYSMYIK